MNWWPCFICESLNACPHREPEIRLWIWERQNQTKEAAFEYLRKIERKPPERAMNQPERRKKAQ
jgi:hypothetical protein